MGGATRSLRSFRPVCLESPFGPEVFQFQEGSSGPDGTQSPRIGQGALRSAGTVATKCQTGQETSQREAAKTRSDGSVRSACPRTQARSFRASRAEEEVVELPSFFNFLGTPASYSLKALLFYVFFRKLSTCRSIQALVLFLNLGFFVVSSLC